MNSLRRSYRLQPLSGDAHRDQHDGLRDAAVVLGGIADDVAWYDVEAPHRTIFQQPHADVLGEVLDTVLRETEREASR